MSLSSSYPSALIDGSAWHMSSRRLGEAIRALRLALLSAAGDASVRLQVRELVGPLRTAFAEHRRATEGETGLYARVVDDNPRLANTVQGLVQEHQDLDSAMVWLVNASGEPQTDVASLREVADSVVMGLSRHRQHDADLVHEAYSTDIGGE